MASIRKLKSGYAIYHKGKRETAMLLPDKKSADVVLRQFNEYAKAYEKNRGMKP